MILRTTLVPVLVALQCAQSCSVDWPVYGGNSDHTHYSTLGQITPENVAQLRVAWTYETHDEFGGSEMQANPIILDGVLYATTPRLRVIALDPATGEELWNFDPNTIDPRRGRYRHRFRLVSIPLLQHRDCTVPAPTSTAAPVVTKNGLLFIGATTYDRKCHVYDKLTGKLLWETELPASGNATPSLYMVKGKQDVVIACGGGKNGAPSGGTFVAFALP